MLHSQDQLDIDSQLVFELKRSNYYAFEQLYDRYASQVLQRIKRLVIVEEEAEEIFQHIFMKIWEERESLPVDTPFRAILFQKAKSASYNFYRKINLDKKLQEKVILTATENYNELIEYLDFKETNHFLMESIEKLPIQRQKVFKYIKLEGKSYEEAAIEFNVSLSTIKDHMTRALRFLREELSSLNPTLLFLALLEITIR